MTSILLNRSFLTLILISLFSCTNQNKTDLLKSKCNFITDSHIKYPDILPNYISDQLKGKAVYVDIWGTWCRPCREEIPFSRTLQAKFENKNIAFLFLCCHCEEKAWKKMVTEFDLPGIHIILNEDQVELLLQKFQITGFPSYMIFDKNGNLQYGDAPRPSSRAIEGILNAQITK